MARRAGPAARKMLERFLDEVAIAEAEYVGQSEIGIETASSAYPGKGRKSAA